MQQIENRRRVFLQQLFPQRVIAGLHDFLQVLDHAVADSRKFFQLLRFLDKLLDGFGQAIDKLRRFFIAPVPPDDGPINFKELRRFPQDSCDLFVVHERRL